MKSSRRHRATYLFAAFAALALALAFALTTAVDPASAAPREKRAAECDTAKRGSLQSAASVPTAAAPVTIVCARAAGILGDVGGTIGDVVTAPVDVIGDVAGGAASAVASGAMESIAKFVGEQTGGLIEKVMNHIRKTTSPQVDGPNAKWFNTQYVWMMKLAAGISLIVVMLALITGVLRADAGAMAKSVMADWPMAFIAMAVAVGVTEMSLQATDAVTRELIQGFGSDMKRTFTSIAKLFSDPDVFKLAGGSLLVLITGIVAAIGALLIWIELIIREALVYLTLWFLPLGMVVSIHPGARKVAKRFAMVVGVIVFSKFLIVGFYAMGAKMIATGTSDDVTRILAGTMVMFIAASAPMFLIRLLPFDEIGDPGRPSVPGSSQAQAQMSNLLQKVTGRTDSSGSDAAGPQGPKSEGGGKNSGGGPNGGAPKPTGGGSGGSAGGGGAAGGSAGSGAASGGAAGGAAGGGAGAGAAAGSVAGPVGAVAGAAVGTAAEAAKQGAHRSVQSTGEISEQVGSGQTSSGGDLGEQTRTLPHIAMRQASGGSNTPSVGAGGGPKATGGTGPATGSGGAPAASGGAA